MVYNGVMKKPENSICSSRRTFLKQSCLALATLPFVSLMTSCTKKGDSVPEGQKELSETDPVAQALGYKHVASAVEVAKFPKKSSDGESAKCITCAQYTAVNGSWGKCNIFPQGLVASEGWCSSWSKKAS